MLKSIEIKQPSELTDDLLDQLHVIERSCFSDPWPKSLFIISDIEFVITAQEDETLVGFACFQYFLDECHILNVAVLPEYRHRGIGNCLVRWMFDHLDNARDYYLEVRKSNFPAIQLYEKLGFKTIGKRKQYYGDNEDALVMHLRLR